MSELEARRRVAIEALRLIVTTRYNRKAEFGDLSSAMDAGEHALVALDAITAPQPQGETMEVHLYRYVKKPWLRAYLPGDDGPPPDPPYYLVAKWTGPVPPLPPAVPVVAATVEPV